MRRVLVSGIVQPGGAFLPSSLTEISSINNVYLMYGTSQTYITAIININYIQSNTTQLTV